MEHPPFDSPLLPLKRTPLALDQRPRALRIVHTHTGLTMLRYFLFFCGSVAQTNPKKLPKWVGKRRGEQGRWYGSGPYFCGQEIDLHLSFQAQQNGVLLLGAMEALQLHTRCKLTVPGSHFLFISAESHGSICKPFPVPMQRGKMTPYLCRFPVQVWMLFGVTSDPGQSLVIE